MSVICLICGGLCFLYFLGILCYVGKSASEVWIWPCAGCAFLFLAFLLRKNVLMRIPAPVRFFAGAAGAVMLLAFLILLGCVLSGMFARGRETPDYLIVLGAQVKGEVPSRSFRMRLEKAYELAEEYPEAKVILTGGLGDTGSITEAEAGFRYLKDKGIAEQRMIREDRSTSTWENLRFADSLTGCASENVRIISSDFHIFRSLHIARKLGYKNPEGAPAPSDRFLQLHFVIREILALTAAMLHSPPSA